MSNDDGDDDDDDDNNNIKNNNSERVNSKQVDRCSGTQHLIPTKTLTESEFITVCTLGSLWPSPSTIIILSSHILPVMSHVLGSKVFHK